MRPVGMETVIEFTECKRFTVSLGLIFILLASSASLAWKILLCKSFSSLIVAACWPLSDCPDNKLILVQSASCRARTSLMIVDISQLCSKPALSRIKKHVHVFDAHTDSLLLCGYQDQTASYVLTLTPACLVCEALNPPCRASNSHPLLFQCGWTQNGFHLDVTHFCCLLWWLIWSAASL